MRFNQGASKSEVFCSNSLPLTSTRWFNESIQAFPHYKKCRQLISATSRMNNSLAKNLGNAKNRTRAAGQEAMLPPLKIDSLYSNLRSYTASDVTLVPTCTHLLVLYYHPLVSSFWSYTCNH